MLSLFPYLLDFQFYGPAILRFALGAIFLVHGWQKLSARPGMFWAWLVTLVEFFGGILLLAGLFTQLVALILTMEFLVILLWVQRGKAFVGGREFDFLIFAALLALLVLGPGAFAFDLPL